MTPNENGVILKPKKNVLFKIIKYFFISLLLLLIFFLILLRIFLPENNIKYSVHKIKYAKSNLNIRKEPIIKDNVIKVIYRDDKIITFDSIVNGYIMVLNSDNTKFGWASNKYLQKKPLKKSKQNINKTTRQKLEYSIQDENLIDIPIKSQISQTILIHKNQKPSKNDIKELLLTLYKKADNYKGLKYHSKPTLIFIYLFSSIEKATNGQGQWIGMISKDNSSGKYKLLINDIQLNSISKKEDSIKWGLTINQRKTIWKESYYAEVKAQDSADKVVPLDGTNISNKDLIRNADIQEKIQHANEKIIIDKYKITRDIFNSIIEEALENGWTLPR